MTPENTAACANPPHLAKLLKEVELIARARGMCMVAHFIGCARMALEEEAAQYSQGSSAIN